MSKLWELKGSSLYSSVCTSGLVVGTFCKTLSRKIVSWLFFDVKYMKIDILELWMKDLKIDQGLLVKFLFGSQWLEKSMTVLLPIQTSLNQTGLNSWDKFLEASIILWLKHSMTEMGTSHEGTGVREFRRFQPGYIDLNYKYSREAKNMTV